MENPENDSQKWINQIFTGTTSSKWLRQGMTCALKREPVEALNDAQTLTDVLRMRWDEIRERGKHGNK